MNLVDAYNITLNIGHPASINYMEAEEEIAREVLDRYPLASVARICEAIGAGRRVFELSLNLSAAKEVALDVMEGI